MSETKEAALRCCPFCGGKAEADSRDEMEIGGGSADVACTECGASGGEVSAPTRGEAERCAIAAWNARHEDSASLRSEVEQLAGELHRVRGLALEAQSDSASLLKRHEALRGALGSIEEYWNGSPNEEAMKDACEHAVHTAATALRQDEEAASGAARVQP
jgi:hypothetical protein